MRAKTVYAIAAFAIVCVAGCSLHHAARSDGCPMRDALLDDATPDAPPDAADDTPSDSPSPADVAPEVLPDGECVPARDRDCDGLPDSFDPCPGAPNLRVGTWGAAAILSGEPGWTLAGPWSLVPTPSGLRGAQFTGATGVSYAVFVPPVDIAPPGLIMLTVWVQRGPAAAGATVGSFARNNRVAFVGCHAGVTAEGPSKLTAVYAAGGAVAPLRTVELPPGLAAERRFVLATLYSPVVPPMSAQLRVACRAQNTPGNGWLETTSADPAGHIFGISAAAGANAALVAVHVWRDLACER